MDVRAVRDLVQQGKAIRAPNYHAGRRGLGFLAVLTALERCYHVARDERAGFPDAWYAFSNLPNRRRLRIDFNVSQDDAGNLLLVVTAYDA